MTPLGAASTLTALEVGVWLSLVERCVRVAEVGGSNPLTPTMLRGPADRPTCRGTPPRVFPRWPDGSPSHPWHAPRAARCPLARIAMYIDFQRLTAIALLALTSNPGAGESSVALAHASTAQPNRVGTLRITVPNRASFVLHGTMMTERSALSAFESPFQVLDPDGVALPTQCELVARLLDGMVVEIRALVDNRWSGEQTFDVVEAPSGLDLSRFDLAALGTLFTLSSVEAELELQNGQRFTRSLTGFDTRNEPFRMGSATITLRRDFGDQHGGGQVWSTLNAESREIEFVYNWHNGALPAQPDLYFRSLGIKTPQGWTWTPILPDPAAGNGYLVTPDDHVIPQRMERSFRFVVHPVGTTPDIERSGWAVSDWSQGGYQTQSIPLPDLDHVNVDLTPQKNIDYDRLRNNQATSPGETPVSPLWPAKGVKYGGMTGGIDIHQFDGVALAVTGRWTGCTRSLSNSCATPAASWAASTSATAVRCGSRTT